MRRLGENRGVRRATPAPRAAAPAVEDGQLDAALAREPGEPLLRTEDLPLGGDDTAVLAGVGVADHHLEPRARPPFEELGGERLGSAQVVDRLQQRHDGHVEPCLRRERFGEHDVLRRVGHRDDQGVDRVRPAAPLERRGLGEHLQGRHWILTQLTGMQPQVERRPSEPENVQVPSKRGQPAVRDT